MRPVLDVCAMELRRRLRDRSAPVVAFLAPVALAVIISTAFGGADEAFHADVAVADLGGGEVAAAFRDEMLAGAAREGALTVTDVDGAAAVERAVDVGDTDVGIVLGSGLDRAFAVGSGATITVVRAPGGDGSGDMVTSLVEEFLVEAERRVGDAGASGPPPLTVVDGVTGGGSIDAASYFGPAMALFFAFFVVGAAPRNLLADQAGGQLARLRAAPVPAWTAGVGITLAAVVLAGASVSVVWLVTALAFGATWGDPAAVAALVAVTVLAIGALTVLVTAVARTPQQASSYVSVLAFGLGLLGGHFFAQHQLPPVLQTIASLTPNGQALRTFTDLTADGATLVDVWPSLVSIGAFAVVTGSIAVLALSRRLAR